MSFEFLLVFARASRTFGYDVEPGSLILIARLVTTLILWRMIEKTLSVDNINTPRAETFCWMAILSSKRRAGLWHRRFVGDSGGHFGGTGDLYLDSRCARQVFGGGVNERLR